jgi:hypothetical protein
MTGTAVAAGRQVPREDIEPQSARTLTQPAFSHGTARFGQILNLLYPQLKFLLDQPPAVMRRSLQMIMNCPSLTMAISPQTVASI